MSDKNLEIAKTWFVLAEIMGVITGLSLITAGFFLISNGDIFEISNAQIKYCENNLFYNLTESYSNVSDCINDLEENYNGTFLESQKIAVIFLILGIFLSILTLAYWIIGRIKIENENFSDNGWGVGLSLFFIIIIALCIVEVLSK